MNYKIAMIPLLIAGIFASCNDDEELIKTNPDFVEAGYGALTLTLKYPDTPGTKAVGDTLKGVATAEEKTIKSVAFFVNTETETNVPGVVGDQFGAFGSYFSDELVMSTNGLQEELKEVVANTPGEYTAKIRHRSDGWRNPQVIVIANYVENGLAAKLKAVNNWAALEAVVSETLTENPQTPLLMYASKSIDAWKRQTGGNGGGLASADFDMQRLVSRIDIRNYAYNQADKSKGFVLTSAQLIRPKKASYLVPPKGAAAALDVSATPFAPSGKIVEEGAASDMIQKLDSLYAYENSNTTTATATAVQINGTYRGGNISKVIEMKKADGVGTTGAPIALARNTRYVININPAPDSTDITWDIVVKEWAESDTIKVKPKYAKPALSDFTEVDMQGATWDNTTKTLNITNVTDAGGTFTFKATGTIASVVKLAYAYDTDASSIGGANPSIVQTGTPIITYAGSKVETPITINIPKQNDDEKVPLDITVTIANGGYLAAYETITIKSRPIYNKVANALPVLMKDGKYWAPINVGAINTTNKATSSGDITAACGQLFQWGRLYGFAATSDASVTKADTTGIGGGNTPLGRPVQGDLANMSKWDTKFIYSTSALQYNWLLLTSDPTKNPVAADMVAGAWYQQLWNKNEGVNNAAVDKTDADPCPKGWRVPTIDEWKAIGAGQDANVSGTTWDAANLRLTVPGKENGTNLFLPAAGQRNSDNGTSSYQGSGGPYWSSSVPAASIDASYVFINSSGKLNTSTGKRAVGQLVRCIQE